ncbi:MAG: UDP-N-acetylmuramate dehydrogenase [Bacteroidales bacterium]|nr:UDP-N-acetylmuramate dehydrogenase [Bacteroidales bacterium]
MTISENKDLLHLNTFGISARAQHFAPIHDLPELKELILQEHPTETSLLVLGGGSNVLFTKDFDGWVLHNGIKGIEIIEDNAETVLLRAGGGENWSNFVDFAVENGWWGLENLSLIPGTVGAAPVQNIGAYGTEQKERFISLEACNLKTGEVRTFVKDDCAFGYRSSIFKTEEKGNWFVVNVTYHLQKKPHRILNYAPLKAAFENTPLSKLSASEISNKVKEIRNSKLPDPRKIGNAGSFFKNPVISKSQFQQLENQYPNIPSYPQDDGTLKVPAGWLIEQCGWKGKKVGNTGVHNLQALVLVNHGNATGTEIQQLALQIQSDVHNRFNIHIEPEVLIL